MRGLLDLERLAAGVRTPQQAAHLCAASLLAIDVDTPTEKDYLDRLARELKPAAPGDGAYVWDAGRAGLIALAGIPALQESTDVQYPTDGRRPLAAGCGRHAPCGPTGAGAVGAGNRGFPGPTQPPPRHGVLFIGSSSIRAWSTLPEDFPSVPVINRGFGGSTMAASTYCAGPPTSRA
jgi:hypothetical protein